MAVVAVVATWGTGVDEGDPLWCVTVDVTGGIRLAIHTRGEWAVVTLEPGLADQLRAVLDTFTPDP